MELCVVYMCELRDVLEVIIECLVVYFWSIDESEMDLSYGGEDDDDEVILIIYEREIRDDGRKKNLFFNNGWCYVKNC